MSEHFPPRTSQRAPIQTRVRLRFDDLEDFEIHQCENLSLGGIFVRTENPPPRGTRVQLEFTLTDETELIRGVGEVMWVRSESLDADNQAGMGVRFVELSPGSRAIIFHAVDRHIQDGGEPFDLAKEPAKPAKPADRHPAGTPPAGTPKVAAEPDFAREPFGVLPVAPAPGAVDEADEPAPLFETPVDREAVAPAAALSLDDPEDTTDPDDDLVAAPDTSEPADFAAPDPRGLSRDEPITDAVTALHSPAPGRGARHLSGSASADARTRNRRSGGGKRTVGLAVAVIALIAALGLAWWVFTGNDSEDAVRAVDRGAAGMDEMGEPEPLVARTDGDRPADPGDPETASEGLPTDTDIPTAPGTATLDDETTLDDVAPAAREDLAQPEMADTTDPAPATTAPLSLLRDIRWNRTDGGTEIVLQGEGLFLPRTFTHTPLRGANPRELVRLRGITGPYRGGTVDVGSPEVRRVRTGYHAGNELHVVLDLADEGVGPAQVEANGETLTIRLPARAGG